jgi:hypothetical protein
MPALPLIGLQRSGHCICAWYVVFGWFKKRNYNLEIADYNLFTGQPYPDFSLWNERISEEEVQSRTLSLSPSVRYATASWRTQGSARHGARNASSVVGEAKELCLPGNRCTRLRPGERAGRTDHAARRRRATPPKQGAGAWLGQAAKQTHDLFVWLMAGADLFWEKSTDRWWLVCSEKKVLVADKPSEHGDNCSNPKGIAHPSRPHRHRVQNKKSYISSRQWRSL